jgi:hypothetical protein
MAAHAHQGNGVGPVQQSLPQRIACGEYIGQPRSFQQLIIRETEMLE